jgi:uncharacterized protein
VVKRLPSGWGRTAAWAAVGAFDLVAVVGYAFTSSELVARLPVNPRFAAILGAVTEAYLACAAALLAVRCAVSAADWGLAPVLNPGRRRVLQTAGNMLMAAPFAAIGYGGLVQRTDFQLRETEIPLAGLPADLDGFQILHLSDIHLSPFLAEDELARVIDACRGLHPKLAVVTGDLISGHGDPLEACIRQLARLRADAGIFGCMGNHDYWASAEDLAEAEGARMGIRFLRGRNTKLRFGRAVVNLAGVDYQSVGRAQHYLRGAERMVDPAAFNLLLSHNPDVFPVAARQGYNLMLAGHTHGGQVTVEIFEQTLNPARFITPYVCGLYREGGAAAYVTRGIGTVGVPARFGVRPEISLLRLRKA